MTPDDVKVCFRRISKILKEQHETIDYHSIVDTVFDLSSEPYDTVFDLCLEEE